MTKNMNEELDLNEVARKFVNLPKQVTNKEAVISGGYMTEEEFNAVKLLPRSTEMESGTKWAKVEFNGKEKTLYPFSGLLTEAEKKIYYNYKKGHRPASDGSSSASSGKIEENNKAIDALKAELQALNVPEDIVAKLEQFRLTKRNNLIHEMFGVDNIQMLHEKVNLVYVMFRGPNGEFAETRQPSMIEVAQKGFMPKFTLDQVKDNVKKLAAKGIIVDNVIVDLK